MADGVGVEPTTYSFGDCCSTVELPEYGEGRSICERPPQEEYSIYCRHMGKVSAEDKILKDLTDKQKLFVREYVTNGFNGSEAARTAGYKPNNSAQIAYKLLREPKIVSAVNQLKERGVAKTTLSVNWVIERLQSIALDSKNDGAKVAALDRLGRYLGMWDSGHNVSVNVGVMNSPALEEKKQALDSIPVEELQKMKQQWVALAEQNGVEIQALEGGNDE